MKRFVLLLLLVLLLTSLAGPVLAADKETLRQLAILQTSISQLQSDLRDMRSAMDERIGGMRTLLEQQTATVNKLNGSIDQVTRTVQTTMAQTMTQQGAKVDAVGNNVQAINDSLVDIKARVAKLSEQMTAMRTALETLQTAPPSAAAPQTPNQPPANAPAPDVLFSNGGRDYQAGNFDMAIRDFQDYLKFYPSADHASDAQFWLANALFKQGKYADAVDAYNLVLDRYPGAGTAPDAHYKKGMALLELKDSKAALAEFRTLIKRFPNSDAAKLAQEQVRALTTKGATQPPKGAKPAKKVPAKRLRH